MITYIGPGYLAMATWTGILYSEKVSVDLWCEWRTVGRGTIETKLYASKGTDVAEPWEATLTIDRNGPADHLLLPTLFSHCGQPMYRWDETSATFSPDRGLRVTVHMGGRRG